MAATGEQSRYTEAMLRAFCEGAMEGIVLHETGVIRAANPTAEAMYGYATGEMVGMRVAELAAPQSVEMAQRAVATQRSQTYDGYGRRKDGALFRVEIRGRNVAWESGTIRATVMRAVTDEDEFERERLASVSLLRTTVESTADGILVVNRAGELVVHNQRFWAMWSVPPEVMERGLDEDILAWIEGLLVDPAGFRARVDSVYGSPELESTDDLALRDGRIIERYSRARYAGERLIGRVWSFRDVTDQRRAQRELALSVKMRDEFIGIASHELFTPVTSVAVAMRGLRELFTGAEEHAGRRLLRGAERQIERLSRLVRQLLDVTRIEGGRLTLSREEVDLCEVVRDAMERLAYELERDQIAVDLSLPKPVRGHWDRDRLDQVVTNLVTNAMKFGQGKPISLGVRATDTAAVLEVVDQGIGIAPDRRAIVFERFQRAVSAHHFAGLGLGLFITHQIVEEHGGRVHVESEVGSGSTFRVELPLG